MRGDQYHEVSLTSHTTLITDYESPTYAIFLQGGNKRDGPFSRECIATRPVAIRPVSLCTVQARWSYEEARVTGFFHIQ